MKSRRKKRDVATLGDVLGEVKGFSPPAGFEGPPLSRAEWERAVGTRIAERSAPWRLEKGVLFVRVTHSVWASELALLSTDICRSLQLYGVAVEGLRFSVGRVEVEPRAEPRHARQPRRAPLPNEVTRGLATITDAPLRDAMARAAAVYLGDDAALPAAPRAPGGRGTEKRK